MIPQIKKKKKKDHFEGSFKTRRKKGIRLLSYINGPQLRCRLVVRPFFLLTVMVHLFSSFIIFSEKKYGDKQCIRLMFPI